MQVDHDEARRVFRGRVDGGRAVVRYEWAAPGVIDVRSTFVSRELRGRGLGGRLLAETLRQIRTLGLRVVPTCPFVDRFLREHPEHEDLRV